MNVWRHFVQRLPGVLGLKPGHAFALGNTASLPTCDNSRRGEERRVEGGAGVADQIVVCEKDAADAYAWVALDASGGSGSPGGSNTHVQFNDSSSFGGDSGLTWDKTNDILTITGGYLDVRSDDTDPLQLTRWANSTSGAYAFLRKSRSGTIANNTVVQSGDELGGVVFSGADGTNYIQGAHILAAVDGTPGTNDMPGRLMFSTTADGASSATERARIDSAGTLTAYRAAIFNEDGADADFRVEGDTDANLIFADASADSVGIGTNAPTAYLHIKAGINTQPPLKLTSGTNLSSVEAGAVEYDGEQLYATANTTSGRGDVSIEHIFRLAADGSAIGAGIADFFGANSSIDLPASSTWELEAHLYFLKTTAGTVTYTITNSAANYTNIQAKLIHSRLAGIGAVAATLGAGISNVTTAAAALPATGSLTTGVDHWAIIYATIDMNAAGNIRIRCTESAGTITPRRGSFYKIRRLPDSNVGTFAA